MKTAMTHVSHLRKTLPERKGPPCQVLARGTNGNLLVEFKDGFRVATVRFAVRRLRRGAAM